MMTKMPEIQPDIWSSSQLTTGLADHSRRPTTDAMSRISAASAPVLLMYDGLLFTLLKLRAMTTIVESRAGTMTATSKPGCLPESPISKLTTNQARESSGTLTDSQISLFTIKTLGPQLPRIRLVNTGILNTLPQDMEDAVLPDSHHVTPVCLGVDESLV
jgi:hypothetical protein